MDGIVSFVMACAALFMGAVAVGYFAQRVRKPKRPQMSTDSVIRLFTLDGTYRSRVVSVTEEGFWIDAPLRSDNYVPLRPGETIRVSAPQQSGVTAFKTQIVKRDFEDHTYLLAWPGEFTQEERRASNRVRPEKFMFTEVDGHPAVLVDYSENGARIVTTASYNTGDLVQLELPHREEKVLACVLSVLPDALDGRQASCLRLVFH